MKNIFFSLCFLTSFAFSQNTVTDYDGNSYNYLSYGAQQWTLENAAMETYRDGTPIPQVADPTAWTNLTTGAWCYYDNDPSKGKLYNWYAVAGIHDNDPNTLNKELAPEGWHVPTYQEWLAFEEFLIDNGYNYDGSTTGNKFAKSISSVSGWSPSLSVGYPGNDQTSNNSTGFNALPKGFRYPNSNFINEYNDAIFWSSTENGFSNSWYSNLKFNNEYLELALYESKQHGFSVRFIQALQNSDNCSADGTFQDQEGNSYDYINYDIQAWSVDNAAMETYRDGTPIPKVTNPGEWISLTTGAWCYYLNDSSKGKLYNWYAVAGIHDNNPNTPNKEFSPEGWHVATDAEWTILKEFMIDNGYNFDGTNTGNKIAKAMASTSGWQSSNAQGAPGFNQSINNISCFNSFPNGYRSQSDGTFVNQPPSEVYWTSTLNSNNYQASTIELFNNHIDLDLRYNSYHDGGYSVRFVQDSENHCSAPTGSLTQAFCNTATVLDLTAIGENIQWYDADTGGNLLDSSTVLSDGQMVYASQTIDECESTDRLEVIVGIQNIQISSTATEVCEGESVNLSVEAYGTTFQNNFCSLDDVPNTLHETLLGAWPFCGNANDISGNNFNGTLNGGVTPGINRFGEDNNSYIFDGQPLTYISMGSHELLDITEGSISISAWVNTNNVGGTKTIVSKANTDTSNVFGSYNLHLNGPANFIVTNSESTNGYYSILSAQGLATVQWKHLTAVANIEDLKLRLYFDGQMVSEIEWEGTYKGGVQEFLIGSHYKSNFSLEYMYNFNGSIDDVVIWNRVLNQYEIDYLSMSNSTTYLWSTGDTTEAISVTPIETTEYWVDVTTNGVTCREYITISVTSLAAPTGEAEQTFCEASTVADLTATGDTIQWYDASIGGNLLDATTALADGQVVFASQIINSCESNDRLEVTVSIITIEINASATEVCVGESVQITIDPFISDFSNWATSEPNNLAGGTEHFGLFLSTGRWNDGPDSYTAANCIVESETNLGIVNNFTFIGIFENHYYYVYNGSDGWNNCNNLAVSLGGYLAIINSQLETNFIVSNLPTFYDRGWIGMYQDTNHPDYSEPGGAWFWVDGTAVAMTSNPSTYTWSNGDTTDNISVTPTETTEYWVDVTTNGVTCREYITIDVTSPAAPTANPVQGGCSNFTVGSNNNAFTGENLQWYANPSGGTALPDNHLLVDGTYYYISQTVDGCESSDRFEFLYLAPQPTITIDTPVICEGDSTTVSVSSNPSLGTATFLWNTGETSESITLSPTESTTFWVDQIYNSGGTENIQTVCRYFFGVAVDQAPDSPVSGGDIAECETIAAQNLVATASVSTGQSIVWYDAATGGNVVTDLILSTAGTVTYYAETINDSSGCPSLARTAVTLTITSIDSPTGDSVQSFCDISTIADLTVTGDAIQWYDSATGGILLDNTTALADGQLVYASQTENDCESLDRLGVSVEIDVITDPILITTELDFCLARVATLADLEIDAQGFELEWYDSYTGGTLLGLDTILEDAISYYATLYDVVSGCESLMRLEVIPTVIPCEVIIYNAISINDNGLNDYMVIENAEYFPFNTLEIFNRDGYLVYNQRKYGVGDNLFRGMANVGGIYSQGSNLPTGSYLYVFTYYNPYEQQEFVKKGFLTINNN